MADKKILTAWILCITLILTVVPPVAYAAGESAMAEPIVFTKAAIELREDTYLATIEGQLDSYAAYKNVACEIKNSSGSPVFFHQGTTGMGGVFSFQVTWQDLNPEQDYTVFVTVEDGTSANCKIDNSFYKDIYYVLLQNIDRVNQLIEECKNAGLSDCGYEELAVGVAEYTLPFINQTYLDGDSALYNHQAEEVFRILDEADANAQGYLNQTRTQRTVTPYEIGDIVAENGVLYTQTQDGKKPTFLTGYQLFEKEDIDFDALKKLGINHLSLEISLGPNRENPGTVFIVPYGFRGLSDDEAQSLVCSEDTVVAEGKGAVKIATEGAVTGIAADVQLKTNHTYEYGASILADGAGFIQLGTQTVSFSASNTWQTIRGTYTANADQEMAVSIFTTGAANGIYVDNLFVKEVGTDENLVVNGDFERGEIIRSQYGDFCFTVDTGWIETVRGWLKEAEEHNIGFCVSLIPHYAPALIKTVSPGILDTGYNHNAFVPYNPTDEIYNELLRAMYDAAVENLSDCKALSMFMLANEPSFTASESPYYLPRWQAFLKQRYGTIASLNTAYGTSYTGFEQIQMPETASLTRIYQDYREFNDSLLTQTFEWQTAYLKEKAPHIETVVKTLQSNNYISANQKNANDYENWAEFFEINGCDTLTYWDDEKYSLMLRGMWLDYLTSIKNAPIADLETHILRDGNLRELDPILPDWVETVLWHGAMHNVYQTIPWLLKDGVWRDFSNTLLVNRPECMTVIGEMNYDLNRLAAEIGALQSKKSKIAMYYSRENRDALTNYPINLGKVYETVVKHGETVDFIAESNPQKLNDGQYQLLVMTDARVISNEMLEEISKFVTQGGRLVMIYSGEIAKEDLLVFDTDGSKHDIQTVKKIKGTSTILGIKEHADTLKAEVIEATEKNVRLVDAHGNDINDCEWSYTTYGLEYLVNITNYNPEDGITAYLEIDGERVPAFTDLRTLTEYEGSITLSPYQPVLLRTDCVKDALEIALSGNALTATASVIPTEKLDKAMLILALYKDNALIDVKIEYVDVSESECKTTIERALTESGSYQVSRFIFDEELNPLTEKEEKTFVIQ
ncbi:MAG: beta-galactosidase [Clostridia bacterium]|nr:beta-galactosidase [Clostridia bacterium]